MSNAASVVGLLLALAMPVEARASGNLRVLTSFLPLYCFTANIAGDAARVENLLPPSAGPHDYQLVVRDRERINAATIVVVNGLGIDSWIEPILRSANAKSVVASAGMSNELVRLTGSPPNP